MRYDKLTILQHVMQICFLNNDDLLSIEWIWKNLISCGSSECRLLCKGRKRKMPWSLDPWIRRNKNSMPTFCTSRKKLWERQAKGSACGVSRELKHLTFSTGRRQPEVKFTSDPRFPPTESTVATLRRLCFAYFDVACKTWVSLLWFSCFYIILPAMFCT